MNTSVPRRSPCDGLRALHLAIAAKNTRFSEMLFRAGRDRVTFEESIDCVRELEQLLITAARIEERILFPAISRWLGGHGGPVHRAEEDHRRVRRRIDAYWHAADRFLFSPEDDRAEGRILVGRGRDLVAAVAEHLGMEGEYLFRVAEQKLAQAASESLGAAIEAALATRSAA
jgi:hypothetical protein